ncbi:hypothetical protein CEXT_600751 [Caerostris extrusa]|uniref:Uncharacterized protein n=1 Tax=Caerostris extrusa TaxID=172846 RepID=A0AAV4R665_CAEEX|nr:hypothetical protein CEXT_600751 [Caerostris extrusa]
MCRKGKKKKKNKVSQGRKDRKEVEDWARDDRPDKNRGEGGINSGLEIEVSRTGISGVVRNKKFHFSIVYHIFARGTPAMNFYTLSKTPTQVLEN